MGAGRGYGPGLRGDSHVERRQRIHLFPVLMPNLDPIAERHVANAEAPVGKSVAIRYLLAFAVPLIFPAALIALALIYLHSVGKLAPVPLTGSISFNEKAELLRRDRHMPIDVLAVG